MFIFNTVFRLLALCLLSEILRNVTGQTRQTTSLTGELEGSIKLETTVIQGYQCAQPQCIRPSRFSSSPTYKDCNRAFYNLGFKDGMLRSDQADVINTYGTCAMKVRCGGRPIQVSAGRLLADVDAKKSGGYKRLASSCIGNEMSGRVFVAGGCSVEVSRALYRAEESLWQVDVLLRCGALHW